MGEAAIVHILNADRTIYPSLWQGSWTPEHVLVELRRIMKKELKQRQKMSSLRLIT
jgi:hypothetical protein